MPKKRGSTTVTKRKRDKLTDYLWSINQLNCPCCRKQMYFPNKHNFTNFRVKHMLTRQQATLRRTTLEHIIPKGIVSDNTNCYSNLTIICSDCNNKRGWKFLKNKILHPIMKGKHVCEL